VAALRRDKTDLDRYLRDVPIRCAGVGPDVELSVDVWYYRWLYDRARTLWVDAPGGPTLLLAAINYLPAPGALDSESVRAPCRVVLSLLRGP
jgi:hypothetical protein